jgi:hypothetical protein
MTHAWGTLRVEVRDDNIIVTLPDTNYTVTYHKPGNSPQLLARYFPRTDDSRVPVTQAEFLTRAWKLANYKARGGAADPVGKIDGSYANFWTSFSKRARYRVQQSTTFSPFSLKR